MRENYSNKAFSPDVDGAEVERVRHYSGRYEVEISESGATTTMLIELGGKNRADLTILDIQTHPQTARGRGLGSAALSRVVSWAKRQGMTDICADSVKLEAKNFWLKNGFRPATKGASNEYKLTPDW